MVFYPAGPRTFVIEDGKMTIEFLVDEGGEITGVEERWKRRRKTVPIGSESPQPALVELPKR